MTMLALKSCQFLVRSSTRVARVNSSFYHHLPLKPLCGKDIGRLSVLFNFSSNQLTQKNHFNINKVKNKDLKPRYKLDKVDKQCELIYNHNMRLYYKVLAINGVIFSVCTLGLVSLIKDITTIQDITELKWFGLFNGTLLCVAVVFMNKSLRKFINRIYFNPKTDSYIAVYPSWNFRFRKLEFKPENCIVPKNKDSKKMKGGNIYIRGQCFKLFANDFKSQSYLNEMVGRNPENTTNEEQRKE